jgi:hypothetical protein
VAISTHRSRTATRLTRTARGLLYSSFEILTKSIKVSEANIKLYRRPELRRRSANFGRALSLAYNQLTEYRAEP